MKNLILTAAMFAATLANAEMSVTGCTLQNVGGVDSIVFTIADGGRAMFIEATGRNDRLKHVAAKDDGAGCFCFPVDELLMIDETYSLNVYSDGLYFSPTLSLRIRDGQWQWSNGRTNWINVERAEAPNAEAGAQASAVADANNNASTTRLGASYAYKYIDISGDGIPANAAKFRIWVINLASTYSLYVDLNLERNPQDAKNCRWYCITEQGYATYYEIVDANGQGLVGRWVYEGEITEDMTNAKGELTLTPAETRKAARCLKMWCEKNGPKPIGGFGSAVIVK